jgi:hypothetical protein
MTTNLPVHVNGRLASRKSLQNAKCTFLCFHLEVVRFVCWTWRRNTDQSIVGRHLSLSDGGCLASQAWLQMGGFRCRVSFFPTHARLDVSVLTSPLGSESTSSFPPAAIRISCVSSFIWRSNRLARHAYYFFRIASSIGQRTNSSSNYIKVVSLFKACTL